MSWKMYSKTRAGLTLDRVRATKYMFPNRVYRKLQFSILLMGASVPVSLAAMTCQPTMYETTVSDVDQQKDGERSPGSDMGTQHGMGYRSIYDALATLLRMVHVPAAGTSRRRPAPRRRCETNVRTNEQRRYPVESFDDILVCSPLSSCPTARHYASLPVVNHVPRQLTSSLAGTNG